MAGEAQLLGGGHRSQVQELVEIGSEVPQGYVWKDTNGYGPIDLAVPLASDIPVIDISLLVSSNAAELVKLRSALASWGCFQAINHGIDICLLEKVRELSHEFFHLPMTEKQKYSQVDNDFNGYGSDTNPFGKVSFDWADRLYLTISPPIQKNLKYWPKNPNSFRDVLNEYTDQVGKIQWELLKAMARSLGLPEDRFMKQYGEWPSTIARFNFYPTCTRPDLVMGLKPHSDGSGVTFVLQDKEVQGLQLLKDDQWYKVPIMSEALFIIVGDQLEIMSNGIFKSLVHKVITNSERERNTLVVFCSPDATMEIGPVEELIDDTRPKLFKNIINYVGSYVQYLESGKALIDALRI